MMIRIGEWVNVSSGIGSPGKSLIKGRKMVVVIIIIIIIIIIHSFLYRHKVVTSEAVVV